MWFWEGFSSGACFLVQLAREHGGERDGVGQPERDTESCWAPGRDGDGELGRREGTSACGSAPPKARGSWSRDGAGVVLMVLAHPWLLGLNFTLQEEPREPVRRVTGTAQGRERGLPRKPRCTQSAPRLAALVHSGSAAPSALRWLAVCGHSPL